MTVTMSGERRSHTLLNDLGVDTYVYCHNCTKSLNWLRKKSYGWSWKYNFCNTTCKEEFEWKFKAFSAGDFVCILPGCLNKCHRETVCDENGISVGSREREFCGRSHGRQLQHRNRSALYRIFHDETEHMSLCHHILKEPAQSNEIKQDSSPIHFYDRWDPYYEFTNFARFPIIIDGVKWATSENYFQAQKFIHTPLYQKIQEAELPREAFEVSRSALGSKWIRSDWEAVKLDVMKLALRAKFTQHKLLHDMLLSTGSRPLVEHTGRDSFWGDGGDGSGCNHLGRLLQEVRADLKEKKLKLDFNLLREYEHMGFPSRENSVEGFPRRQCSGSEMTTTGPTHSSDDPPIMES